MREQQFYGSQDPAASQFTQYQAFYPQGHPMHQVSSDHQNQPYEMMNSQNNQYGMPSNQHLQSNNGDISNFDLQVNHPYGSQ